MKYALCIPKVTGWAKVTSNSEPVVLVIVELHLYEGRQLCG